MNELDVLIFPIPKLDKSNSSGITEMADIISKKENHPHIQTRVIQQELDNKVLSHVDIPDTMFPRQLLPKSKTKIKTIPKKYKIEHVIKNKPLWVYVSKLDN